MQKALELPAEFEPRVPLDHSAPWVLGMRQGKVLSGPAQLPLAGAGCCLVGLSGVTAFLSGSCDTVDEVQGDMLEAMESLKTAQVGRLLRTNAWSPALAHERDVIWVPKGTTYLLCGMSEAANMVLLLPCIGAAEWDESLSSAFNQCAVGIEDNRTVAMWRSLQDWAEQFGGAADSLPPSAGTQEQAAQAVNTQASDDVTAPPALGA